jgi:two-component system heavy metal sensor histidine kinase CusS
MKLRRRLIAVVTAVTMVALGSAFAIVFEAVYHNQQHQLDVALLAEAHEEALEAASTGAKRLAIIKGPGPLANDIGPLTKYGAIYDFKGRVLDATETFRGHPPQLDDIRHTFDECFDTSFGSERLRAVLVPMPAHDGIILLLAAPRFDLERDAAFLRRAMIAAFVVAVTWAALVATWIVRRLTRGHEAIAHVTRRVAGGDLSARVDAEIMRGDPAQLARDINDMIDRLSTLLTSQQEFIVHAAHELRSPLTLLYGELSLAARRSRDAADYRRAIDESLLAARSLKTLAEDLLVLARAGADTDQPLGIVDVNDVVRRVVAALSSAAGESNLSIRVQGQCRLIRGRDRDLERVFRNIVENAIRHSPVNGVVDIRYANRNGTVTVTISDQGKGVAEIDRERIFQPFYRGPDDLSNLPGFGMGLAIARKLARSFGGDVALGETQTAGAEFVITLEVV